MWRGYPMLIPLRHVQTDTGFVWLLFSIIMTDGEQTMATLVGSLMTLIGNFIVGQKNNQVTQSQCSKI